MKKINLLVVFFILFFSRAFTQTDVSYIITPKSDTIYGEFVSSNARVVKFKVDGKKKSFGVREVFRAFDAKSQTLFAPTHVLDGKVKIPGSEPKKYRIYDRARSEGILSFLEVCADGDIIVYGEGGTTTPGRASVVPGGAPIGGVTSPPQYYIFKKSQNEVLVLKSQGGFLMGGMSKDRIIASLKDFMPNAPELLMQLENEKKLTSTVFINYVKMYNDIKKQDTASEYGTQLF
ncbi:hypothetical protein E2P86_16255 [Sphingobacterium psychroaquaticum]|uniref:hypothetical protein n=1 Tax=Sphingobacterium psychroaquaticum TaxID=561061 RepID=UPI00106C797C|nr:hypothetical protein [Sphingobacterium psychroaquaticum]QBQ42609.1 hypothetical protein E2P86_16255 [Sphingobacterium psychroaquaticum]